MKIEFTGRNFTLSPAIKKHTNEHFDKIESVLNGALKAHVILSVEKHHRHIAEVIVNWHDRALTGKADTTDMYASVSQAVDRIRRQVLKVKGKIIDRKHHALATSVVAPSPGPPVTPAAVAPRVPAGTGGLCRKSERRAPVRAGGRRRRDAHRLGAGLAPVPD